MTTRPATLLQHYKTIPLGDGSYRVVPDGTLDEWIWIRDAARITGLSEQTIRNWAANGQVIARRVGHKYQVQAASLQKHLEPYNHLR